MTTKREILDARALIADRRRKRDARITAISGNTVAMAEAIIDLEDKFAELYRTLTQ